MAVRQELSPPNDFEWSEATIADLRSALEQGRTTVRALTADYISRIEAIDSGGPRLNSIMEVNLDAPAIAEQLDRERAGGRVRGPLHGIPVLLKDNIDTADNMETTAGSLALVGYRPECDAFVVRRLRGAGAVIVGKTNLSEWANFRSTNSTSGWSARAGLCLNPYALDRNTSGSSSGSAAAIAANLAAAALGTETDGSIVAPASANSIVGIKPTLGLVSRAGVIPVAHSQDVVGPMCRTVADAATVLACLTGVDRLDRGTRRSRNKVPGDYTRYLDAGLQGARLGVWRKGTYGHGHDIDAIMDAAIAALADAGATVVDPADIRRAARIDEPELTVLLYEFKADINRYLRTRPGLPVRSLADLIAFNEEHKDAELTWFGQDLFERAQDTGSLRDKRYRMARKTSRLLARGGIDGTLRSHGLDAIVALTCSPPWRTDLGGGDEIEFGTSTPGAVAGYPTITVPAGYTSGLPIGLSFIGTAWSELQLIKLAYAFEQHTKLRRAPEFKSAADRTDYRSR